jgi:YfiH family protein
MSWLRHPLLDATGVVYGFGTRACRAPGNLVRARQVHGSAVVRATAATRSLADDADALVCDVPELPIGVVTADCLPVLIAAPSGAVAAVHAGWRGLVAGVLTSAFEALREIAPDAERGVAVIGPHVGARCYEVDEPVVQGCVARFGDAATSAALESTRAGHWQIDLARLAHLDLARAGLAEDRVAALSDACTACDAERFHSFRRDGPGSGRLFHFIAVRAAGPRAER